MHEQDVCCVLDFYVDQSFQRQGFGKLLFDYMLKVNPGNMCNFVAWAQGLFFFILPCTALLCAIFFFFLIPMNPSSPLSFVPDS